MEYCETCDALGRPQEYCPNLKNDETKEKEVKKYKIKDKYKKGVFLGKLKNGDFILVGTQETSYQKDRDEYISILAESKDFTSIREAIQHVNEHEQDYKNPEEIEELANSGDMSVVKLGLVEEIDPVSEYEVSISWVEHKSAKYHISAKSLEEIREKTKKAMDDPYTREAMNPVSQIVNYETKVKKVKQ